MSICWPGCWRNCRKDRTKSEFAVSTKEALQEPHSSPAWCPVELSPASRDWHSPCSLLLCISQGGATGAPGPIAGRRCGPRNPAEKENTHDTQDNRPDRLGRSRSDRRQRGVRRGESGGLDHHLERQARAAHQVGQRQPARGRRCRRRSREALRHRRQARDARSSRRQSPSRSPVSRASTTRSVSTPTWRTPAR